MTLCFRSLMKRLPKHFTGESISNISQVHRYSYAKRSFTSLQSCSTKSNDGRFLSRHVLQLRQYRQGKKVQDRPIRNNQFKSSLIRPVGFTAMVCGCSFTGAMIWQYENMRQHAKNILRKTGDDVLSVFKSRDERGMDLGKKFKRWWNSLSDQAKVVGCIIGINVQVYLLWQIKAFQPIASRFLMHSIGNSAWSLLLCTFSHKHFLHLFVNMYVLWSLCGIAVDGFGKEQFVSVYLSAGVISSLMSHCNKLIRVSHMPSLGASGAIMAILATVCLSYPDARFSIVFIDALFPHSFSADSVLKFLIVFETSGILFGWQILDHAAHLSGLLFGLWYVKYGKDLIWSKRERVMKLWHQVRGNP